MAFHASMNIGGCPFEDCATFPIAPSTAYLYPFDRAMRRQSCWRNRIRKRDDVRPVNGDTSPPARQLSDPDPDAYFVKLSTCGRPREVHRRRDNRAIEKAHTAAAAARAFWAATQTICNYADRYPIGCGCAQASWTI